MALFHMINIWYSPYQHYGIGNYDTNEYIRKSNVLTDVEKTLPIVTKHNNNNNVENTDNSNNNNNNNVENTDNSNNNNINDTNNNNNDNNNDNNSNSSDNNYNNDNDKNEDEEDDKFTPITKLPASEVILQVDSSSLRSDQLFTKQYENAISDQILTKEACFIKDVKEDFRNKLNLYAWRDLSSPFVEVFKGIVGFPFNPMMKDYATSLSISRESKYTHGKRIFGYLTTPVSGNYKLAVSSSKQSEVWLSTNHHPSLASKVAWVGSSEGNHESSTPINMITQLASQQSAVIHFNADQLYYIEIMHACDTMNSHVQLFWAKSSDTTSNDPLGPFEIIESQYLVLHHLYMDDKLIAESKPHDAQWPMHKQTIINTQSSPDHRIEMINLPVLKGGFLKGMIEVCDPIPQNVHPHYVGRYSGYKEVRLHSLYPDDGTNHYVDGSSSPLIDKDQADRFIMMFKNQLKSTKLSLKIDEILNLETIPYLVTHGIRLLIEAKVRIDTNSETVYRLSEYLFLPEGSSTFCHIPDFQWKRNAFIYLGIPIKNQAHWVRHTVENLERLQKEINDENWGLIISDYESTDMDVLALLSRSTLHNWKYVRLQGSFSRSHGINAFLNEMGGDGDMIGLACDLQLDIPVNFFDVIRTHTIPGLSVSAPIVMRLNAGRFYLNPSGFWEHLGYGLLGMYLNDWYNIGGMNTNEFGNRWGGEDWEFVDRCVIKGIEIQRMLIRNLFHYYHSKDGTWDSSAPLSLKYFT